MPRTAIVRGTDTSVTRIAILQLLRKETMPRTAIVRGITPVTIGYFSHSHSDTSVTPQRNMPRSAIVRDITPVIIGYFSRSHSDTSVTP